MVDTLSYGIIPLDEEGPELRHVEPVEVLTKSLHYLALRQRSDMPYTIDGNYRVITLFSSW